MKPYKEHSKNHSSRYRHNHATLLKRKVSVDDYHSQPVFKKAQTKQKTKAFFVDKTEVSKVKHGVLNRYLGSWLAILSRNQFRTRFPFSYSNPQYSRIVYVDGFAGPGIYENGDHGSPALAYELALTHQNLGFNIPDIYLIFVEVNKSQCFQLVKNLRKIRRKYMGSLNERKVKFMVIKGEFTEAIKWIISKTFEFPENWSKCIYHVPERGSELTKPKRFIGPATPLMVFADPFGYNGKYMPMTLMRKIMNVSTKSEILVNLMTGNIRRFWKLDSRARPINLLVGNNENDSSWKGSVLEGRDGKEMLKIFLQHYSDSLEEGCKQDIFTCLFEMRNQGNRLMYNLYYASPHSTGFQAMKNAMRKESIDETLFRYSAFDVKHPDFEVKEISIEKLADKIVWEFEGKVAKGREITAFIERDPHLTQRYRVPLKKELAMYCISEKNVRKFDEKLYEFSVNWQVRDGDLEDEDSFDDMESESGDDSSEWDSDSGESDNSSEESE